MNTRIDGGGFRGVPVHGSRNTGLASSPWDPVKIDGGGVDAKPEGIRIGNGRATRSDFLLEGSGATIRRERAYDLPADGTLTALESAEPTSDNVVVQTGSGRDIVILHSVSTGDDGTRVVNMDINGQPYDVSLMPGQGLTLITGGGDDDIVVDPDVAAAVDTTIVIEAGSGHDYVSSAPNIDASDTEEGGVEVEVLDIDFAEAGTIEPMTGPEQTSIVVGGLIIGIVEPTAQSDALFGPYPSADAAAIAMLSYVTPLSVDAGREYVGRIYSDPATGQFYVTMPAIGEADGFTAQDVQSIPIPAGMEPAGYYHTHPDGSHVSGPSDLDVPTAEGDYYGTVAYIATSTGLIVKYDASTA